MQKQKKQEIVQCVQRKFNKGFIFQWEFFNEIGIINEINFDVEYR